MSASNKPPALPIFTGLNSTCGVGTTTDNQTASALGIHLIAVTTMLAAQSFA